MSGDGEHVAPPRRAQRQPRGSFDRQSDKDSAMPVPEAFQVERMEQRKRHAEHLIGIAIEMLDLPIEEAGAGGIQSGLEEKIIRMAKHVVHWFLTLFEHPMHRKMLNCRSRTALKKTHCSGPFTPMFVVVFEFQRAL